MIRNINEIKQFKYTPPFAPNAIPYSEILVKNDPTKMKGLTIYPNHIYDVPSSLKNNPSYYVEPVNNPDYNYYADIKEYHKAYDKLPRHKAFIAKISESISSFL